MRNKIKKDSTMRIIVKIPRMLKINQIVESVCFHVMSYIHSSVKGSFCIYQWRLQPCFQEQVLHLQIKWVE